MTRRPAVPFVLTAALLIAGCGTQGPTAVDGVDQRNFKSPLGFIMSVGDYDKPLTQRHAELADRWWGTLMRDFAAAGLDKADPANTRGGWVKIVLEEPVGPDSLVKNGMHTELIGGWYSPWDTSVHVPGDYDDPDGMLGARPAYQPLMHEYTHHWCQQTLKHLCLAGGEHSWAMPDGRNIWDVQWQNNAPAASVLRAQAACRYTDPSVPGSVH